MPRRCEYDPCTLFSLIPDAEAWHPIFKQASVKRLFNPEQKFLINMKAFSFVELLLAMSLGLLLLLGLVGVWQHFFSAYRAQQAVIHLDNDANLLANFWQRSCLNLKVYQVGQDALPADFPKRSIPKLLPKSIVMEVMNGERKTYWFSMQNAQKIYGIYRIDLSEETTPSEYISHVKNFQAEVHLPGGVLVAASASLPWQSIPWVRIQLSLGDLGQSVIWPISIQTCEAFGGWLVP